MKILDEELNLLGAGLKFQDSQLLRGNLPQLDSMAVVGIIGAIEARIGIVFPEDQLDGAVFETVGTLVACIDRLQNNPR